MDDERLSPSQATVLASRAPSSYSMRRAINDTEPGIWGDRPPDKDVRVSLSWPDRRTRGRATPCGECHSAPHVPGRGAGLAPLASWHDLVMGTPTWRRRAGWPGFATSLLTFCLLLIRGRRRLRVGWSFWIGTSSQTCHNCGVISVCRRTPELLTLGVCGTRPRPARVMAVAHNGVGGTARHVVTGMLTTWRA